MGKLANFALSGDKRKQRNDMMHVGFKESKAKLLQPKAMPKQKIDGSKNFSFKK